MFDKSHYVNVWNLKKSSVVELFKSRINKKYNIDENCTFNISTCNQYTYCILKLHSCLV